MAVASRARAGSVSGIVILLWFLGVIAAAWSGLLVQTDSSRIRILPLPALLALVAFFLAYRVSARFRGVLSIEIGLVTLLQSCRVAFQAKFPSMAAALSMLSAFPPLCGLMSDLTVGQDDRTWADIREALTQFNDGSGIAFSGEPLVVAGRAEAARRGTTRGRSAQLRRRVPSGLAGP